MSTEGPPETSQSKMVHNERTKLTATVVQRRGDRDRGWRSILGRLRE
jgi:UDP-N-acetylmuramyl tripeptide synthase